MSLRHQPRLLTHLAWANAVLHVAGLLLALVGMRPGTPALPLPERTAYLAASPVGWTAGWATWMLCAVALVAFMARLRDLLPDVAIARAVVLPLTCAGAAVDLLCNACWMTVIPELARRRPQAVEVFLAAERALGVGGAVAANGLYSLGVAAATAALARAGAPRLVLVLGGATLVAGFLMVGAGFTGNPRHLEVVTGPVVVAFVLWSLATARWIESRAPGA